MALTETSAPAIEPITVDEARAYLRLDALDGEPAPTALTAALAGDGAGNVDDGIHSYVVTFVTADGETEAGTASSTVTTTSGDGKVDLSAIPVGGASVTSRKIYRTEAGGATYKLLTTISDNTTTTYEDDIADSALGAGAPSTNSTEDPILNALITASRVMVEEFLNRALISQTWTLTLDGFPWSSGRPIYMPKGVLSSVTSIVYTANDGTSPTWTQDSDGYTVDTESVPGRVYPSWAKTYPTTRADFATVVIVFVAGYGAASSAIPTNITIAMRMLLVHLYEHRGEANAKMPATVEMLLWPYRMLDGRVSL